MFCYTAWQESDGEFSLYDDESGGFMSHYASEAAIIERFSADVRLDGGSYQVDFRMNQGVKDKVIVLIGIS